MGDWREAGRALQRLREDRGWTVPRLADELRDQADVIGRQLPARISLVRMIREWEAGTHRPRDYLTLFVLIYASRTELWSRVVTAGSELDRLMAVFEAMGIPTDRRRFLLNAAAIAAGVAVGPAPPADHGEARERLTWVLAHPSSVDLETVAHLHAATQDLLKKFHTSSSSDLVPEASRQLERVVMCREHAQSDRLRQELSNVEVHCATLLGRIVWDALCRRDHAAATHYYERALEASRGVTRAWAEALPRIQQCLIAIYHDKDPARALELASRAAVCAGDGSSHVLTGEALCYVAEAHALRGRKRACEFALDRARSQLEAVTADDPAHGRFSRDWIGGFAGACHLHLGEPKLAESILREAALCPATDMAQWKPAIWSDLAISLIRQRQPEQAVALLHDAIDLVQELKSGGGMHRLLMAGQELRPWLAEPFAQELWDRLLTLGLSVSSR